MLLGKTGYSNLRLKIVIKVSIRPYCKKHNLNIFKKGPSSNFNKIVSSAQGKNKIKVKKESSSEIIDKHPKTPAVTRFAPSPTGFLHLGSLRTALYNYLLAKNTNGKFILRLEDTDQTRLVPGAEQNIYECLDWLEINPDYSPHIKQSESSISYKQSERRDIYDEYSKKILESGHGYKCFCTKDRLESLLQSSMKMIPRSSVSYDRHCLHLSKEEISQKEENGEKYVVRLKSPDKYPIIKDEILGEINHQLTYNLAERRYDDPVLVKSDGLPTYHFANVVDDHLMNVTHVIRGEEWVTSTMRHLYLYEVMGWEAPKYLHLPLLGTTEGTKLSKRKNDSSIWAMKKQGYLPEALINYVAAYGWSIPKREDGTSIYTLEELVPLFNVNKLTKGFVKVIPELLEHMNKQHLLRLLKNESGILKLANMIINDDDTPQYMKTDITKIQHILRHVGSTMDNWKEFPQRYSYCYLEPNYENEDCKKFLSSNSRDSVLKIMEYTINHEDLINDKKIVKTIQKDFDMKSPKMIYETLRYSLTGFRIGSSILDIITVLGKDECLKRIKASMKHV
ncbi:related to Glutamate--tRNA ligase, mitochondrial [Hanseniaspora guilliermondii]|uniref:Glutamate--tRNA ligase, mitochondrial n=1 Tax=Hanseniaspora guilliermondii TaxID=56406 RepID=A0A1L0CWA9_9ASCO|nr:related to Glutamate--tRNA ligase, mitochondrial [Hanseniaspora guilliermondii]